ncbi:hypothetical protein Tco_1423182 [Tanacetum coccineum]
MRCSTEESRFYSYTLDVQLMSRDAIIVHEMFNGWVDMQSVYMRCSTEESGCYSYTLDVQLMSQDAIFVHEMFNGWVERNESVYWSVLLELLRLQVILLDLQHLKAIVQDLQHLKAIL